MVDNEYDARKEPINHTNNAYKDTNITSGVDDHGSYRQWTRTFSKDVKESELEWHVDGDRTIEVKQSDGQWGVVFEGSDPVTLETGMSIESPANVKHLPLKNKPESDLIIEIKEYIV